jgi:hypothetical protein
MTNNLTLEQILEAVKKKYPEAKILENDIECGDFYIKIFDNTIQLLYYTSENDLVFSNIIELKHYLDIDIEWEDLIEYIREIIDFEFRIKDGYFIFNNLIFYKNGNVETMEDYTIAINRSYWQMYNIIKNIVEN